MPGHLDVRNDIQFPKKQIVISLNEEHEKFQETKQFWTYKFNNPIRAPDEKM